MTAPKRGRPQNPEPTPASRAVRLSAATAAKIEAIAKEQGFEYGGQPSLSQTVDWLAWCHAERQAGRKP